MRSVVVVEPYLVCMSDLTDADKETKQVAGFEVM